MMRRSNDKPETGSPDDAGAALVSALMDGVLSGPEADAALAAAVQPEGQERWQLYHLIGDTLRNADLAVHQDAALLAGVRAAMRQPALGAESARLPPAFRHEAANDGLFRWKLAAGFASVVAVAAIGWSVWGLAAAPSGRQLAQMQPPLMQLAQTQTVEPGAPGIGASAASVAAGVQRWVPGADSGKSPMMLRDPQLDRLLAAHRRMAAFGGGTSAFLRNATFEEPPR